uniref:Putative secreted peptide n=1 Tax=Anopheles braziliensis TaxID=58242 RepID=A0A2M3ZTT1_9DIPT
MVPGRGPVVVAVLPVVPVPATASAFPLRMLPPTVLPSLVLTRPAVALVAFLATPSAVSAAPFGAPVTTSMPIAPPLAVPVTVPVTALASFTFPVAIAVTTVRTVLVLHFSLTRTRLKLV